MKNLKYLSIYCILISQILIFSSGVKINLLRGNIAGEECIMNLKQLPLRKKVDNYVSVKSVYCSES